MNSLDDLRIGAVKPLIYPQTLLEKWPISEFARDVVARGRRDFNKILSGQDDRLAVVVGPCSIHDHDQAIEYAHLLVAQADQLARDLLIVMRVYFEKPRTTVGWKGYINDPHLDGSLAINDGLELARRLLLEILELGLPVGTEFLDLLTPQFFSDLVSWGAIGARTTESQSHRQLASGLSCPVGFKNGTEGSVKVAVDALLAARAKHAFIGMTKSGQSAIFETLGNRDCHIILRGGKSPNYDRGSVQSATELLLAAGLSPAIMIDVSHANSSKQYQRQIQVTTEVAEQIAQGDHRIIGLMMESHLQEGRQDLLPGQALRRGVSITDPCISFAQTQPLLELLAESVVRRRTASKGDKRS